ncbi:hypothetical protein OESDEN_01445 [Oesophagostomum dentatum]|uniref:Uncharacterized protein n=1 Tax=Oesophagostomum dentatum TaxID=61180 RepID=A0A0B1TM05_OESDE|nr:hypothetical protein OESDEN_01445 [Oesophagostomum dentatum]
MLTLLDDECRSTDVESIEPPLCDTRGCEDVSRWCVDSRQSKIRLDKLTPKEVKEEIQKQEDPQDDEPLRDVTPCPSEYQLTQLNYMLSGVPIVQAFNEAEKKKKKSTNN